MENPNNQNNKELKWSVMGFWNQMLGLTKRYPPKVRDYISPADLGKDYWSRYQKMMGIEPTNPFEDRVLRIFSAGDEFHHLMKNVFKALGIFINSQDDPDKEGKKQYSIIPATEKALKVLGSYDVLAGGKVDIEQTERQCHIMNFSDFVTERTLMMAKFLQENYPDGLPTLLYEIKSINSLAFWNKKDYLTEAYPHHRLQCFAYLKANNIPEGRILYVSKDDLMTAEFPIYLNDEKLNKAFEEDREQMSYYIFNKQEPPKPDNIIFDPYKKFRFQFNKKKYVIEGCFDFNWEIARSQYFTLMTGMKSVDEWKDKYENELKEKNNQLKEKIKGEAKEKTKP